MSNYNFIKEFQNIKITDICDKFNIDKGNLTSGRTTEENYKKVKDEIVRRLLMLIIEDKHEELITLYLYDELIAKLEKENKMLRELV